MIPVSKPSVGREELDLVEGVFSSNWLGLGKFVEEFEDSVSRYIGSKYAIAVNSCTSALHLALEAYNIGKGDEVIVPSQTFAASIQAILASGATPIFCEITPHNFNIDIDDFTKKITPKTRAVMPVHMYGIPCDMDELIEIAENNNIIVIEDAAHAFGSEHKNKKIGSFGHITCFSFDPIKNITCGEGGIICLSDSRIANLLKKLRNIGISTDSWSRNKSSIYRHHEIDIKGYRYHMSNINAAIGIIQLKKVNQFRLRKQEIVNKYNEYFKSIPDIELLDWQIPGSFPFSYTFRVMNGQRDRLMSYLKDNNIGSAVNYKPNHLQPAFSNNQNLPVTEELFNEMLSIPLFYDLADENVDYIINRVVRFFEK